MAHILDGKKISNLKREQLKQQVNVFKKRYNYAPKLSAIIVGDDPASKIYVRNKAKACEDIGMTSQLIQLDTSTSEMELLAAIETLNKDPSSHGILVQLPLPQHISSQKVIESISPDKDVDGFHPYNVGKLTSRIPSLRPCTPYGIMQLLEAYNLSLKGKDATIIGVSNIVGRPLALEFLLAGATVTSCHRHTRDIERHIKTADIVVSATGVRNIFDQSVIPSKAIVIDVGIHRINNKVCGDLDFDYLKDRVEYITPVPGGVGPMTITVLLQNTYQAALNHESSD